MTDEQLVHLNNTLVAVGLPGFDAPPSPGPLAELARDLDVALKTVQAHMKREALARAESGNGTFIDGTVVFSRVKGGSTHTLDIGQVQTYLQPEAYPHLYERQVVAERVKKEFPPADNPELYRTREREPSVTIKFAA